MKYWWVLILVIPFVCAAKIQGTVYDFGLNTVHNAIVTVNTTPVQRFIASQATYQFEVSPGSYSIEAHDKKKNQGEIENITITENGSYVLDLIMLPELDSKLLQDQPDVPIIEDIVQDSPAFSGWLFAIPLAGAICAGYLFFRWRKKSKQVSQRQVRNFTLGADVKQMWKFIEDQNGRTTQKELRDKFPYSEAKISLMIDELEAKELVKRIKKGRSNLILRR